jgi:hypothetical protein
MGQPGVAFWYIHDRNASVLGPGTPWWRSLPSHQSPAKITANSCVFAPAVLPRSATFRYSGATGAGHAWPVRGNDNGLDEAHVQRKRITKPSRIATAFTGTARQMRDGVPFSAAAGTIPWLVLMIVWGE